MSRNILAVDYGHKRVGLAISRKEADIARPYATLSTVGVIEKISEILIEEAIDKVVVGLPRNLDGDDTQQTAEARQFAQELKSSIGLPVIMQDEAGTSVQAKERLQARGKKYQKEDIDQEAAVIILEDYLNELKK